MKPSPDLLAWLPFWASWMRHREPSGIEGQSWDVLTNYMAAEDDSDVYWERHHVPYVVGVIDVCIDSLPPIERHAIWYKFGIRKDRPEQFEAIYVPALFRLEGLVIRRIAI